MSKLLLLPLLGLLLFNYNSVNAQSCTPVVAHNCDVSTADNLNGFTPADLLPCIVKAQPVMTVIPFKVFRTLALSGSTDTIYRMKIESITNLPCGLCWSSSSVDNIFTRDQAGCIAVTGTTNDAAGQYKLNVVLSFDTNNSGTFNQPNKNLSSIAANTGQVILLLLSPDDSCPSVNYNATGLTATTTCP